MSAEIEDLRAENAEVKPKVEFFNQVADFRDALQMRDVTATLNLTGGGGGIIYSNFCVSIRYWTSGTCLIENLRIEAISGVIEQKWTDPEGETRVSLKTLFIRRVWTIFVNLLMTRAYQDWHSNRFGNVAPYGVGVNCCGGNMNELAIDDTMNDIQIFNNPEFGQVRAMEQNGKVWFVAKDVCDILGLEQVSRALDGLENDERAEVTISNLSSNGVVQRRAVNAIDESGLYTLIFKSHKPGAKVFRKWVTSDVLPVIRRHGVYAEDELLDNPDLLLSVVTRLKEERDARIAAQSENMVLKPKAEFFDAVADSRDVLQMRDVAATLNLPGWGRNRIFKFLREQKVLDTRNVPYREYEDRSYFRVIELKWSDSEGDTRISLKTLVYQKGVDYIRKLIEGGAHQC
jgi:prophage antirepressor-like protein